ncbi:hypothetical protein JO41_04745 [Treponema sp. OMZ 838]|nr:hypothetical protein JO41_04745 [Treponema sp. OMZ 838]
MPSLITKNLGVYGCFSTIIQRIQYKQQLKQVQNRFFSQFFETQTAFQPLITLFFRHTVSFYIPYWVNIFDINKILCHYETYLTAS